MQPLERGRALHLGGQSRWVSFKYEKFPHLCFNCGCIVHGAKGCHLNKDGQSLGGGKSWGVWLRAKEARRRNT
jgi:hypothetical protein